jgi:hypothetical protein
MTAPVFRVHGLRVRSEIPLHERLCPSGEPPDIAVFCGHAGATPPIDGDIVGEERDADGQVLYHVFHLPSGYRLRAYGICDFDISQDLTEVTCHPEPGVDPEWIPLLLRGTVMALLLDLRGSPSLHASAVEIDGRGFAFAGSRGSGKTTTAALLCVAGGRLVTDDVLAVELSGEGPRCAIGSAELRLRQGAVDLCGEWVLAARPLIDGRLAVRPVVADGETVPLTSLVFPAPSRSAHRITVHRVKAVDAVFRLATAARITGWRCPELLRRALSLQAKIAAEVPVFDATIPWGPPWDPDRALSLLDQIDGALA